LTKLSENLIETDLLYITKSTVSSARGSGTGKLHTALAKLGVKRVVLGNFDGDTLAVSVVLF
jgi:ribosomal protein L11 methylase PrmA